MATGDIRWRWSSSRYLGHRPEPLLHERLWACPLLFDEPTPESQGWTLQAGLDRHGAPVAYREIPPRPGSPANEEWALRTEDEIVVDTLTGVTVRTQLDAHGRAVCTRYSGDEEFEERYHYDGTGRLVAIDEPRELWTSAGQCERVWTGGHLTVEYDGDGVLAIRSEDDVVWERPTRGWPDELAVSSRAIADEVLALVRAHRDARPWPPTTEVFALGLIYVDQGSLHTMVSVGLEEDRGRWRSECDPDELISNLWHLSERLPGSDDVELFWEGDVPSAALDLPLLRDAAIRQPGDPYRCVLTEVARHLARADWTELFTPTHDFVVFIAEHDEGYEEKVDSVHAVNPPERVAAWEASWPRASE